MSALLLVLGPSVADQVGAAASGQTTAVVAPMVFQDVTGTAGISYSGPSWSVAWGDVNGDALPDLYTGNHGALHDLYLKRGNGHFSETGAATLGRNFTDTHGAAWADFDNDGDQDLVELVGADRGTSTTKANHLFVNQNGMLVDQARERGLSDPLGRGRTPLWFDWDGDGLLDLLAVNAARADAPPVLFHNNHGYFERTGAVAITAFTRFAVLGSLQQGKTHVIVSGEPFPQRVYDANQVSPWPLYDLRQTLGLPLQGNEVRDVALLDVNGDGVDDILEIKGDTPSDAAIGNGKLQAHIVINDGGGTRGFRFGASEPITVSISPPWSSWWNVGNVYIGRNGTHPTALPVKLSANDAGVDGLSDPKASKGIYIGYDRSAGKWEVRVVAVNFQEVNFVTTGGVLSGLETIGFKPFIPTWNPTLLLSANGQFTDATYAYGLSSPAVISNCFSATAADFDNDGDVDIFASCSGPMAKQGVENLLLRNQGAARFTAEPSAGGVIRRNTGVADGVAAADFDIDGFVDLALTNGQGLRPFGVGPTQLFRNSSKQSGNLNHWVEIDLQGVESNRDGVGARVRLTAGGRIQYRIERTGVHNGAQDFARLHFGLGSSTVIQSLEVQWPSGMRQSLKDIPADRLVKIVEGRGWSTRLPLGSTAPK